MDIRVFPYPPDLKVISEPGSYDGWGISIEKCSRISTIIIPLEADHEHIAHMLEVLAHKVRGNQP